MAIKPKECTLVLPLSEFGVWLAKKTRVIGIDLYNGYGGGINPDETPEEAALRELVEETGGGIEPDPSALAKVALIDFHNIQPDGSPFTLRAHVYVLTRFGGEPRATEEMADPRLFPLDRLPRDQMMPADPEWVPLVLAGNTLEGEFWYNQGQTQVDHRSRVEITGRWRL